MDHRSAVLDAINHRQPSRTPYEFGATGVSGIHSSLVAELRDFFGLEKTLVKVPEPSAFLGWIDRDLADALGNYASLAMPIASAYGVPTVGWKEWRAPWGQEVLIPAQFAFTTDENGDVLTYPQGDQSAPPSGKMPSSSYFIDAIIRQQEFDEDDPDPRENTEEYSLLSESAINAIVENCRQARATGRAVVFQMPGTSLGDISRVPGVGLKHPKGIRDIEEWYISLSLRPDFVRRVLEIQAEIGLENLKLIHRAGGDDLIDILHLCGTDFGTQIGTFCSLDSFQSLWAPSYRNLCGWVHDNTPWKIFKHSCGSVESFIDSFIEVGIDILNPVQCSAANMEPHHLKTTYGDRITFWGGGVDTQRTLPFGTPEEVKKEVMDRLTVFSPGGGFVFTTIHNTQARTPLANFVAMLDGIREFNGGK